MHPESGDDLFGSNRGDVGKSNYKCDYNRNESKLPKSAFFLYPFLESAGKFLSEQICRSGFKRFVFLRTDEEQKKLTQRLDLAPNRPAK